MDILMNKLAELGVQTLSKRFDLELRDTLSAMQARSAAVAAIPKM